MNWFLFGFGCGMIVMCVIGNQLIKEHRAATRRWHRRAMEYMELWFRESQKRRAGSDDDADWWKK